MLSVMFVELYPFDTEVREIERESGKARGALHERHCCRQLFFSLLSQARLERETLTGR